MEPNFANVENVANKTFDYIIVAGSVLAGRLSEESGITVLLLEAGKGHINDPLIDTPSGGARGFQLGNPDYDWAFETTSQKNLNGRTMIWNR
ncbi:hypothetical protein Clacol_003273 [Clathrus columnatus]|uniref:Glucose dehydrogenase n=1 Tax=Clathrus columnatus TaxID=1419009 RepID=A0AAV5A919_9AGAM|nr:hypothetical protein Clacol_003273 [Clathrus columnatus]